MKQSQLVALALGLTAAALAACSGGGHTVPTGSRPAPTAQPSRATTAVKVTLLIPKRAPASRRGRKYVSSSTLSASISVNGTQEIAFSTASGAPGCQITANGNSCTASVDAPVGSDTFTLSTYDGALSGGTTSGNLLSTGTAAQTILSGKANAVNLTLAGAVAFFALAINPNTVPAGVPTTVPVIVQALDADENTIIGPGDYVDESGTPLTISVSDADPSATTSLDVSSITAPGTAVNLSYTGTGLHGAVPTITASSGALKSTATFFDTPTIQAFASFPQPPRGGMTVGGDGNLYVLHTFPDPITTRQDIEVYQVLLSTGAVRAFTYQYQPCPAPTTGNEGFGSAGGGIATGPDGNVYFAVRDECMSSNSDRLVGMTPAGAFSNPAFNIGATAPAMYGAGGSAASIAFSTNGDAVFTEGTVSQASPTPQPIATGFAFLASSIAGVATYATYANALGLTTLQTFFAGPNDIAIAPDGSAWFPGYTRTSNVDGTPISSLYQIVRSTTAGAMTAYSVPQPMGMTEVVEGVTAASDGNIWFVTDREPIASATVVDNLSIGNVTSGGTFTDVAVTDANNDAFLYNNAIVDGLNATLYSLTSIGGNSAPVYVAQVTHAGVATVAAAQVVGSGTVPTVGVFGSGVRAGDGNIYYNVGGSSLIKLVY